MTDTVTSARRDAKRDTIIEVARQVFFEEGYAAASMSTIAARLGGSKGTLYNYFKSKEELFEAYIRETCGRMGGPVFELPDPGTDADLTEVQRTLTDFGVRFLQFLLSDTAMRTFQLVTAEAHRSPGLAKIFYEAGPQAGIARITRYLEAAKAAGLIAPPDCNAAALQLMSLCRGHLYLRYSLNLIAQPTADEVRSEIAGGVSVFLGAYGVRAA